MELHTERLLLRVPHAGDGPMVTASVRESLTELKQWMPWASDSYGEKDGHKYQNTSGIMASQRKIPADIPKEDIISSSFTKLDPKEQLREAGPPFSFIGNELVELHGKWEVVSHDVKTLTDKLDETKSSLLDKVDSVFEKKITTAVATVVGAIAVLYGLLTFLQSASVPANAIATLAILSGIGIPVYLWYMRKK